MKNVFLSIIVPVKDEAPNLEDLAAEINLAMDDFGRTWECIWVDDGSTDATLSTLRAIHTRNPRHRFIALDRNHGQTAALLAGFRSARGQLAATLDGDGQNDPADLPVLIAHLEAGSAGMVAGIRVNRRDNWLRRLSSAIANSVRNRITGERISDVGCSSRVFRIECVRDFPAFEGMHRFLPTVAGLNGWETVEVPVRHRPRRHGTTKYGVRNRVWKAFLDAWAVRWMQRRCIRYHITEESGSTEEG